jgi:hypothetical protein
MKSNHKFAIEYAVRLLRINIAWNGPISGRRIHSELKRTAVTEFRNHLQIIGDFPPPPPGMRYARRHAPFAYGASSTEEGPASSGTRLKRSPPLPILLIGVQFAGRPP